MRHHDPDELPDRDPTPPENVNHPADCGCHVCDPDDPKIIQRHWHGGGSELVTLSTALACLSGHLGYPNFVATGQGSSPNCFYQVRPENMAAFGKAMRLREEAVNEALGSK